MSFIVKLTDELYLAFDWRDVFRACAFVGFALTALALGLLAPRLRRPARLIPWLWAWALVGLVIACLPFALEWWFYRIAMAFGLLITARSLGMRARRFADLRERDDPATI